MHNRPTLDSVDSKSDIREFLTTRRAKISPEQANLPTHGKRRVPGLRREEVAALAGVSVDYYNRLERGNLAGASEAILESIANALQLDEAERLHLHRLARAANPAPRARRVSKRTNLSPSIQRVLDGMADVAAIVRNGRMDLLAASTLGRALYSPAYDEDDSERPNLARFAFLSPSARTFYPDWQGAANVAVTLLRTEAGRNPHDPALTALVGELSTRSDEFRVRWGTHNVRTHYNGTKVFRHPAVGELTLAYDVMDLPGDGGLSLTAYTAEPNSPSADALKLLASWAATALTEADEDTAVR
jgi:transcriptional regulator with XRE-family HTH domain